VKREDVKRDRGVGVAGPLRDTGEFGDTRGIFVGKARRMGWDQRWGETLAREGFAQRSCVGVPTPAACGGDWAALDIAAWAEGIALRCGIGSAARGNEYAL